MRKMGKDPYKKIAKTYDRYVEPSIAVIRQIGMKMYPPKGGITCAGCRMWDWDQLNALS
jgi:hypothetical protein